MNIYADRIDRLQQIMRDRKINYYIIELSDPHGSEYFDDYFNVIKYISGFSGSNATILISDKAAYLWTDGRYFIQAESELDKSGIILMKLGLKGTLSVDKFLAAHIRDDDVLALDAKTISVSDYERYNKALSNRGRIYDCDIVSDIRDDNRIMQYKDIWMLDLRYAGESVEKKILRIRESKEYKSADALIMSDLCDIAWTLNLRGNDIEHMPVFYAYLIISNRAVILYVNKESLGSEKDSDVYNYLRDNEIIVRDYDAIYDDLSNKSFYNRYGIYKTLIDKRTCNTAIYTLLNEHTEVFQSLSVAGALKCIKNETEINNIKKAHIKDGIAVNKFLYYLERISHENKRISELQLVELLHTLRSSREGFLEESFETICAWAENGAIVHYEPTNKTDTNIGRDNFLLVDSGGHYLEGSTDITRTFLIGKADSKMKRDYTLVLKSHIALARAIFYNGTTGKSLDMLVRNVMWQAGYDYMHGTGHGVGYLLSVHEGPNNISIRSPKDVAIKPGMVTTDEPGIYLEGEYGIRLEDELLCIVLDTDMYGERLGFESLTLVPFQLECIDISMLTGEEIEYINRYHKRVYDTISPYLNDDELSWLKSATRHINKD